MSKYLNYAYNCASSGLSVLGSAASAAYNHLPALQSPEYYADKEVDAAADLCIDSKQLASDVVKAPGHLAAFTVAGGGAYYAVTSTLYTYGIGAAAGLSAGGYSTGLALLQGFLMLPILCPVTFVAGAVIAGGAATGTLVPVLKTTANVVAGTAKTAYDGVNVVLNETLKNAAIIKRDGVKKGTVEIVKNAASDVANLVLKGTSSEFKALVDDKYKEIALNEAQENAAEINKVAENLNLGYKVVLIPIGEQNTDQAIDPIGDAADTNIDCGFELV